MLLNMHIKNIALIDDIDISFLDKLNILTGETGAGKSIIIGSIGICLGDKFSKELLRDETKEGVVELLFSVENEKLKRKLEELGIEVSEDEILIERRIGAAGRAISRINDRTVTGAKLREVAGCLIDLHAQHEQQTLLKVSKHLEIVDDFGGEKLRQQKSIVGELYSEYVKTLDEISEFEMDENEKNKQMDFLSFQINEIGAAKLREGEDEELEQRYKRAVNSKEILSMANTVYSATEYNADASAAALVGHAASTVRRMADIDTELSSLLEMIDDIDGMLSDFNRELKQYMSSMEFDEQEFADMEERLNLINSLKVKYGRTIGDIIATAQGFEQEYGRLVSYEEYMSGLNAHRIELENKLRTESDILTGLRREYAERLCEQIRESLLDLNFENVEFDMRFEKLDKFSASGNDHAYFVISTNIGESPRPLYEVASGGELSRVMLALKSCQAYKDDTPTLIFDEIDVGISGRTAQKVAEKMAYIAGNHQVICITHLPQIAAMADAHYIIEKNVENNKTVTTIRHLSSEEEINEIARLLGGASITDNTIASAKEMKSLANKVKFAE